MRVYATFAGIEDLRGMVRGWRNEQTRPQHADRPYFSSSSGQQAARGFAVSLLRGDLALYSFNSISVLKIVAS